TQSVPCLDVGCWLQPLCTGSRQRHLPGSPPPGRFLQDDYAIQVAINDYLDIYCPHYEGAAPAGRAETFTLFMVDREGYRGCYETPGAFKRWECNRPHAPFGPVRFSEKIQRFTPFSLGFEFQPGETYYYISVPSPESAGRCLKLRVSVCCKATSECGAAGRAGASCPGSSAGAAPPAGRSPKALVLRGNSAFSCLWGGTGSGVFPAGGTGLRWGDRAAGG
uniref:Ephrin-A4 n=1 Tax=Apteryx owenii TaxID=8824 RepID=A0A8B9QTU1_APTOW